MRRPSRGGAIVSPRFRNGSALRDHLRVEFRVLGPLEVVDAAGRRRLGGAKQRTLLGLLLVHAGQVVSSDRLVDALWGERPPPTAPTSLRNLVTQLRKVVGPGVVATRAPGYVLEVAPEQIDLTRFELLVAEAQGAEPAERAHALRDALALWRGPALADLAFESALAPEIARLEELRLEALEARIDADLTLGAGPNLVPELEKLVAQHPYREQLRGQLMLALYRSGRQVEALDAYLEARHSLVNEVGVDPSEELQRLHGQILRQEPTLMPGTAAVRLPRQPTPFLGRERELGDVLRLLGRDEVRLLTLTGAGGSGKTRLALEAAASQADRHSDGVFWVPLAPLGHPARVVDAIVEAVGPLDGLAEKRLLLVVDNFEHVLPASGVLSEMIASNPHVRVLVTSREPLRLAAEYEYAVPTMDEQDAVRLFSERAGGHEDDKSVLAVCRRLDCLPLAIELAAARTKLLAMDELLARLSDPLPLLTHGPRDADDRHRALETAIAWSYDLLAEGEQRLFARLAIFAGGWTIDAAEEVCDAELDMLQSLVDKSLIHRHTERYGMLETVRAFAAERLDAFGAAAELRRRHAAHYMRRFERLRKAAMTPASMRAFADELNNVRLALADPRAEVVGRLVVATAPHWFARDGMREAAPHLRRTLNDEQIPDRLREDASRVLSEVEWRRGNVDEAVRLATASFELACASGDPIRRGRALNALASAVSATGDIDTATLHFQEAVALLSPSGADELATAMSGLAHARLSRHEWAQAAELFEEVLAMLGGRNEWSRSTMLGNIALAHLRLRNLDRARQALDEAEQIASDLGSDTNLAYLLITRSALAAEEGRPELAARTGGAAEAAFERLHLPAERLEHELQEQTKARVCADLGEDRFAKLWEEGRFLELDEAVSTDSAAS